MVNIELARDEDSDDLAGHIITMIVPAPGGCNLRCGTCFISQRGEIGETELTPGDYAAFIAGIARSEPTVGVALQGYEPLLPGSMPYTTAILASAAELGIPSSLVTNGTHLETTLPALAPHMPRRIGVSLDAAAAQRHDHIRGVSGAWEQTVAGIREALRVMPDPEKRVTVVSVLMPWRRINLEGMPQLLDGLGVRDWIVNPLTMVGKNLWAHHDRRLQLLDDLGELSASAERYGIRFTVDDELGQLQANIEADELTRLAGIRLRSIPRGVVVSRLLPSGHCAIGMDIGRPQRATTPRWNPQAEHPAAFMNRVRTLPLDLPLAA